MGQVYIIWKPFCQYGIMSELSGATISWYRSKYTDTYWSIYSNICGQVFGDMPKYTILSLRSSIWKLERWGCMKNVCSREPCDSHQCALLNAHCKLLNAHCNSLQIIAIHYTTMQSCTAQCIVHCATQFIALLNAHCKHCSSLHCSVLHCIAV